MSQVIKTVVLSSFGLDWTTLQFVGHVALVRFLMNGSMPFEGTASFTFFHFQGTIKQTTETISQALKQ